MVVIRLARSGSKKKPFYHVVVADRRMPRDGRYIEQMGYFNPVARGKATRLSFNLELIQAWVAKGAQPSPRVQRLLKEYAAGEVNARLARISPAQVEAAESAAKPKSEAKANKAETKVETKAEAKPAEKAEAKPADKVEAKPADKAEAKPAEKAAAKADKDAAQKDSGGE